MHANNRQWSFQKSNGNVYDDDDRDDAVDENFSDFGVGVPAGRMYSQTIQPKQWCTSYVANRQHYVSKLSWNKKL